MAGVNGIAHGGHVRRHVDAGGGNGGAGRTDRGGGADGAEDADGADGAEGAGGAGETEGAGRKGRGRGGDAAGAEGAGGGGRKHRHGRGEGGAQAADGAQQAAKADDADEAENEDDDDAGDVAVANAAGGGGASTGMSGCAGAGNGAAAIGADAGLLTGTLGAFETPATALPAMLAPQAAVAGATGAVAAAAPSSPLIATASAQLTTSPIALQVLQAIDQGGAQIRTVPDAQFASEFGARTAGAFDPKTNTISLPEKVASDPAQLRLVLVHEGIHWLQDNMQGGAEALGGSIGQALTGANAVRSTAPGKADLQHDEAQAYLLEALVANQAGISTGGLGTDRATGRSLGYDAILAKIKQTPEYA